MYSLKKSSLLTVSSVIFYSVKLAAQIKIHVSFHILCVTARDEYFAI